MPADQTYQLTNHTPVPVAAARVSTAAQDGACDRPAGAPERTSHDARPSHLYTREYCVDFQGVLYILSNFLVGQKLCLKVRFCHFLDDKIGRQPKGPQPLSHKSTI